MRPTHDREDENTSGDCGARPATQHTRMAAHTHTTACGGPQGCTAPPSARQGPLSHHSGVGPPSRLAKIAQPC